MKNKKVLIIGLAIVVIAFLFNELFLKEYLAISEIRKKRDLALCSNYYIKYPNGRYTEEVNVIEIELANNIKMVLDFLDKYPNSEYFPRVEKNRKELWQKEIDKYLAKIQNSEDYNSKSVQYLTDLLNFMKDSGKNTILLQIEGDINLDDWNDYSTYKIMAYEFEENKMLSLRSNFESEDISEIEKVIENSLQGSFENVLDPGFINIITENNLSDIDKDFALIKVTYRIQNKNEVYQGQVFPFVWTYYQYELTDFNKSPKNILGYLLGIDINFFLSISIPNHAENYNVSFIGDPGSSIENIEDIEDGYKKMTMLAFEDFGNTIAKKFLLN